MNTACPSPSRSGSPSPSPSCLLSAARPRSPPPPPGPPPPPKNTTTQAISRSTPIIPSMPFQKRPFPSPSAYVINPIYSSKKSYVIPSRAYRVSRYPPTHPHSHHHPHPHHEIPHPASPSTPTRAPTSFIAPGAASTSTGVLGTEWKISGSRGGSRGGGRMLRSGWSWGSAGAAARMMASCGVAIGRATRASASSSSGVPGGASRCCSPPPSTVVGKLAEDSVSGDPVLPGFTLDLKGILS